MNDPVQPAKLWVDEARTCAKFGETILDLDGQARRLLGALLDAPNCTLSAEEARKQAGEIQAGVGKIPTQGYFHRSVSDLRDVFCDVEPYRVLILAGGHYTLHENEIESTQPRRKNRAIEKSAPILGHSESGLAVFETALLGSPDRSAADERTEHLFRGPQASLLLDQLFDAIWKALMQRDSVFLCCPPGSSLMTLVKKLIDKEMVRFSDGRRTRRGQKRPLDRMQIVVTTGAIDDSVVLHANDSTRAQGYHFSLRRKPATTTRYPLTEDSYEHYEFGQRVKADLGQSLPRSAVIMFGAEVPEEDRAKLRAHVSACLALHFRDNEKPPPEELSYWVSPLPRKPVAMSIGEKEHTETRTAKAQVT
jgi:hypothetical protein